MGNISIAGQLTLAELAKRSANGQTLAIAEVLSKTNEIFQDAIWLPSNGLTGHIAAVRTALPSGTWRGINEGVSPTSSSTKQVVEALGTLEAYSEVDKALVGLAPDPVAFRQTEDLAFLEGLSQDIATAFIYGDPTSDPRKFKGLSPRVTSKSAANAVNGSGSGDDTTSIWIVQWGAKKVYFTYVPDDTLGITAADLGQATAVDSNGKMHEVLRTHFRITMGLVVEDDRCIQRLCNIETAGSSNIFSHDNLIKALNRLPYGGAGAVIYCNQTIKTQMDIAVAAKTNILYTASEYGGAPVTFFRGVPVRRVDAILDTETALA